VRSLRARHHSQAMRRASFTLGGARVNRVSQHSVAAREVCDLVFCEHPTPAEAEEAKVLREIHDCCSDQAYVDPESAGDDMARGLSDLEGDIHRPRESEWNQDDPGLTMNTASTRPTIA